MVLSLFLKDWADNEYSVITAAGCLLGPLSLTSLAIVVMNAGGLAVAMRERA